MCMFFYMALSTKEERKKLMGKRYIFNAKVVWRNYGNSQRIEG